METGKSANRSSSSSQEKNVCEFGIDSNKIQFHFTIQTNGVKSATSVEINI
jgi:hypothetical protein